MRAILAAVSMAFGALASAQPCLPTVTVKASGRSVRVDEALTPEQRVRGLMFRRSMAEDQGMWFVFDDERPRSFWMRNTYLALDIIYVDASGRVVSIIEKAEPLTETPRPSTKPAKYVLEVVAGGAARLGIRVGGMLTVCGTPGPTP